MDFPLVAEDDSRPVGLAWVRIDPADAEVAELYQVWVDPTYRRRGVGRLVVDSALDWARTAGVRQMVLSVALGPSSALDFYRRLGFIEVGEPVPLRTGSTSRKQTMQRTL
jgi:GNAT superfamily N-acetyltransferase